MKKETISYIRKHEQFPITLFDILATIPTLFVIAILAPKVIIDKNVGHPITSICIYSTTTIISIAIIIINLKNKRRFIAIKNGLAFQENKEVIISLLQQSRLTIQQTIEQEETFYCMLKDDSQLWLTEVTIISIVCSNGKILLNKRPRNKFTLWNAGSGIFDTIKDHLQKRFTHKL
jgi:hypothetical protein